MNLERKGAPSGVLIVEFVYQGPAIGGQGGQQGGQQAWGNQQQNPKPVIPNQNTQGPNQPSNWNQPPPQPPQNNQGGGFFL